MTAHQLDLADVAHVATNVLVQGRHVPHDGKALAALVLRFGTTNDEPVSVVLAVDPDRMQDIAQELLCASIDARIAAIRTQAMLDAAASTTPAVQR